jgi:hypothetical protein
MVAPAQNPVDVLRERLAAYAHAAWSGWMDYMLGKCRTVEENDASIETDPDDLTIPGSLVRRWNRQRSTAYADLPEDERDSDRKEADAMLALLREPIPQTVVIPGSTSLEPVAYGAVALYWRGRVREGLQMGWVQMDEVAARQLSVDTLLAESCKVLSERYGDDAMKRGMLVFLPATQEREALRSTLGAINSLLMTMPSALPSE